MFYLIEHLNKGTKLKLENIIKFSKSKKVLENDHNQLTIKAEKLNEKIKEYVEACGKNYNIEFDKAMSMVTNIKDKGFLQIPILRHKGFDRTFTENYLKNNPIPIEIIKFFRIDDNGIYQIYDNITYEIKEIGKSFLEI